MKDISQHEKIHANKISGVLQHFFIQHPESVNLRSTDVYDILVTKGLVERDMHQGIKFRQFLFKLYANNALVFLPQCSVKKSNGKQLLWFFNSAPKSPFCRRLKPKSFNEPVDTEYLINGIKKTVAAFPKRDTSALNWKALQIRTWYPRAYEYWTLEEETLLRNLVSKIPCKFKLSELLMRQPSAIEKRLELLL